MSSSFENPLKIASKKHDVVGLRIYDQRENNLPNIGLIHMQDNESDKIIFVDTSNKKMRMDFANNRSKKIKVISASYNAKNSLKKAMIE